MTLWDAREVIEATAGTPAGAGDWRAAAVSIDSRTLAEGALFVALKGANHDGHDHLADAGEAGAAAALVHRDPAVPSDLPLVRVDDTMDGLRQLAAAARERAAARRVAVTGSVGKTTTRHILAQVLAAHRECHASEGNLNNHIGAPLSLARMPAGAAFGVFELGMNHAGEISALSDTVRPHHAVITRVAKSHIGHFPSLEAVAEAKGEIFDGIEGDGTAFLCADDPFCPLLSGMARRRGAGRVVTVGGSPDATHRLLSVQRGADGLEVEAAIDGDRIAFRMGASGTHNAYAGLFALAVAEAEGLDRAASIGALARTGDLDGRGRHHGIRLADGRSFTLVDDSYNASPASMEAAIRDLAGSPRPGRRVAVLADMLELGDESRALHEALAEPVLAGPPALLILYGKGMEALARVLAGDPACRKGGGTEIVLVNDAEAATAAARERILDGDIVLVKGSNGMGTGGVAREMAGGFPGKSGHPAGNGESHVA